MNLCVRNLKDFWTGVVYIFFGTAAIIISRNYDMGTAFKMGPSYFPVILSSLLVLVGTISLVRSFIKPGTPFGVFALRGLILIISSIILFGIIVRGAGLVVALPVLVIITSYASTKFRWKYSIALAAGLTVFCILVFLKGLGVPLPVLGPWFS